MDDPLLVRVLDGVTYLHEQVDPPASSEILLVAVISDSNAAHQFHHEIGTAGVSRAGIENLGDVWMIHEGQRLTLGLEAGDDRACVHPKLNDLDRDLAPNGLGLLS